MQIGKLAEALDVPYRAVRYTLERGHADHWVRSTGGSGHHRDLSPGEAFALALLLKLKQAGLRTPVAERVVALVEEGLRSVAGGFGWDYQFRPFDGQLATQRVWFAEVGDARAFRIVTDANPSLGGKMEKFNWTDIRTHRTVVGFEPCVVVRIDLARLARLVQG